MTPARRTALFSALLAAGFVAFASKGPPKPLPADAPPTEFSADRAMKHVRAIAQRPHRGGTAEHARVREVLVSELQGLGLTAEIQRTTAVGRRVQFAGAVQNIVARLPGTTGDGRAVLLVTHYDGVGAGPAASDDGAGCAAQLEVLRALKAGAPLAHDVIFLFTDLEEVGLVGAAGFATQHPWAKDVEAIVNVEARGTGGVASMFQTGPGNLGVIRLLRALPEVAGSSIAVTVYQYLPNDTDLSELFSLGKPSLNFAFADGVERYHTTQDDADHLDPGALQQEGAVALGMVRALGSGPLPLPATGNAIFFELPALGIVLYPESWALPLAGLAVLLALGAVARQRRKDPRWLRGLLLGTVAALVAAGLSAGAGLGLGSLVPSTIASPDARGAYLLGLATLALAFSGLTWAVVGRWVTLASTALGPLLLWAALAAVASWKVPGASYVVLWPALASALAALFARPALAAAGRWASLIASGFLLGPVLYGVAVVAFGPAGPGGAVVGALVAMAAWLCALTFEPLISERAPRRFAATLVAGLLLVAASAVLASRDTTFPSRSTLVYAQDADRKGGWWVSPANWSRPGSWGASALGPGARPVNPGDSPSLDGPPTWLTSIAGWPVPVQAAPAPRVALPSPEAALVDDTVEGEVRWLTMQVLPGAPADAMFVRVTDAEVQGAMFDGHPVELGGFRRKSSGFQFGFAAPPQTGFRLELRLPKGSTPALELVTQLPGLPEVPGVSIPPRPGNVLPSQWGDFTSVYRRVTLAPPSALQHLPE